MTVLQIKQADRLIRVAPLVGILPRGRLVFYAVVGFIRGGTRENSPVHPNSDDFGYTFMRMCSPSIRSAGFSRHSTPESLRYWRREAPCCSRIRENSGISIEGIRILTNPAACSARQLTHVPTEVDTMNEVSERACGQFGRLR